jgi:protein-tyrosine phosphatase
VAAALLARRLAAAGVTCEVSSAGTRAESLAPATRDAITAVAERGLDISSHRSRALDPRDIADADLVLGMTREHVREVVTREQDAWRRTFTFKEIVRRGESAPRRHEPLADWVEELAAGRGVKDLLGSSREDDIEDPVGLPLGEYRKTVSQLDDLAERLVGVGWAGEINPRQSHVT